MGQVWKEAFEHGPFSVISRASFEDVLATMETLGWGEISAGGAGVVVGLDKVLIVLTCVAMAGCKLGEAAHLWASELLEPWSRVKGGAEDKGGQIGFTALFYRV